MASDHFRRFSSQNNRIARGLCVRNLGAKSGRELFKGTKDLASLLVCTRRKIFWFGVCGFFVSGFISGGLLRHLGPLHLALGSNCYMIEFC